jgi:HlyD family secretion protein
LAAALTTNGKLEPLERSVVRSAAEGLVKRLTLKKGQRVRRGDTLVELENPELADGLASAESTLAQLMTEMGALERGGSEALLAEIDSALVRSRSELETAKTEAAVLDRLVARQAATRFEADQAHVRIRNAEQEIASLQKKRATVVPVSSRPILQSRIKQAESAVALAKRRIEDAVVKSPMDGVLYDVAIREGSYLRPGDEIASIGKMDVLRAVVYVDEPELGRVAKGQRVEITWDAEPGRKWDGVVESLPTQVVPLNSRQVGEVLCAIGNADGRLPAGANVNVSIITKVVENALTVPKESLRKTDSRDSVFALSGDHVEARVVKLGVATLTEVEVVEGLRDGDRVALGVEPPLVNGEKVAVKAE